MKIRVMILGIASLFALAGCPDGDPGTTPVDMTGADTSPDATPDTTPDVDPQPCYTDPNGDEDDDGLENRVEVEGWTIVVDGAGLGLDATRQLETRTVFSDPCVADTDADGFDDQREFTLRSDPSRKDTDGDGLTDFDEIDRWTTSPNSVDSDGDARGCDPDNPGVPVPTMFDGAELLLVDHPTDPTLPKVPGSGATSPAFPDTDGDGVCDTDEIASALRSPIVAEMPRLDTFVAEGNGLDVRLVSTYTDGETITQGSSTTVERGQEMTRSRSDTLALGWSTSATVAFGFTEMVGLEGGVSLDALKASASLEARQDFSFTLGFTGEYSYEMGQSNTASLTKAYSDYRDVSTDRSVTTEFGQITVPLTLENSGSIAYSVEGLEILLKMYDPGQGKFIALSTMKPEGDSYTLSPGDTTEIGLADDDIPADLIKQLLRNPRALAFTPTNFGLKNADGTDFKFVTELTYEQTALVMVDIGSQPTRSFRIATNVDRGPGGTFPGVTMGQLLDDADLNYETALNEKTGFRVLTKLEEWEVDVYPTPDAPQLDALAPYPDGLEPGERWFKRGWATFVTRQNGEVDIDVDFDKMIFGARDEARLMYVRDDDRDGIFDTEEFLYGSSDLSIHSDGVEGENIGDGLSDYWEIRVGWTVDVRRDARNDNPPPYAVKSNPRLTDSDGDGWDDNEERIAGTDPGVRDTDGDGQLDPIDDDPLTFKNTAPSINDSKTPPPNEGARVSVDGNTVTMTVVVDDPEGNIQGLEIGWSSNNIIKHEFTQEQRDAWLAKGPPYTFEVSYGYAQSGVKTAGVRAYDTFGEFSNWAPRGGFLFRVDGDRPSKCYWNSGSMAQNPAVGGSYNPLPDTNTANDTNPACPGLPQDNMSMSAWVKLDATNANNALILGESDFPALVMKPGGRVALAHFITTQIVPANGWPLDPMIPDPTLEFIDDPTPLSLGQWTHYTATLQYDIGGSVLMTLYRNGAKVGEAFSGRNSCGLEVGNTNCGKFLIGKSDQFSFCNPSPYNNGFVGQLQYMSAWRRTLSEAEVAALYSVGQSQVCRFFP